MSVLDQLKAVSHGIISHANCLAHTTNSITSCTSLFFMIEIPSRKLTYFLVARKVELASTFYNNFFVKIYVRNGQVTCDQSVRTSQSFIHHIDSNHTRNLQHIGFSSVNQNIAPKIVRVTCSRATSVTILFARQVARDFFNVTQSEISVLDVTRLIL